MTVQVTSAGETYHFSTGKKMEWKDVPEWFKQSVETEMRKKQICILEQEDAQKCILEKGFWNETCVTLWEAFNRCVEVSNSFNAAGKPTKKLEHRQP